MALRQQFKERFNFFKTPCLSFPESTDEQFSRLPRARFKTDPWSRGNISSYYVEEICLRNSRLYFKLLCSRCF